MTMSLRYTALAACIALAACNKAPESNAAATASAPGAPGQASTWAYAGKTGIGTSYEAYQDGKYQDGGKTGTVSKVWFSLAQGVLTETMYGLIHEAQLRELQWVVQGTDYVDEEKLATTSTTSYLLQDAQGRPLSLAYKVVNKANNGQYEIEKHYFTDPEHQTLVIQTFFKPLVDGLKLYSYIDPAVANTGSNDQASARDGVITAVDGQHALALVTLPTPVSAQVGFVGVSDGLTELKQQKPLASYSSTGDTTGNVAALAQMPTAKAGEVQQITQVIGFGDSAASSLTQVKATLARGIDQVLADYNGDGAATGWQDYLTSLSELNSMAAQSNDQGRLLYASALVLKAQEDKTHAGAFIASLSNPWGDVKSAEQSQTGYKAVWPRDFYQVSMALLAMGDAESPKVAFQYLQKVQVNDNTPGYQGTPGWFLQKTHVDGELEWVGIQMDQTAMPIMLGYRLWQQGILDDQAISSWYQKMLKPAADFLAHGGSAKIDWNDIKLTSPMTQQERWEEQAGYSPSTIAAVIAGLVTASEIATKAGDSAGATLYLSKAREFSANLENWTYTTQGQLKTANSDGQYYLRINKDTDPNNQSPMEVRNGQQPVSESAMVDGGFLELVRYGVRPANHPAIIATLPEMDDQTLADEARVKYELTSPSGKQTVGWRRYGYDGYGEDTQTGLGYAKGIDDSNTAAQRGRVWPIFSGERGHYEIASATANGQALAQAQLNMLRGTYAGSMEAFANQGLMLPEQVFDGVGNNDHYRFAVGQGTDGATPLAWSHAEYVKLLRSLRDQKVWDHYPVVQQQLQSK